MRGQTLYRQHPVGILENASKRLWLLIFPALRGLLALGFDFFSWVRGAWFDILVILALIILAVLRWRLYEYRLEEDGIFFKRGFLGASGLIPYARLASVSVERPWLYRPIGAARVRMDTMAGGTRAPDLRLTLPAKRAEEFELLLQRRCLPAKAAKRSYAPARRHLVLFSLLSSSTLSGALFLSALISQAGAILGRNLDEELLATITDLSRQIAIGIPPIAIAVSAVLMLGWLAGFTRNILRHMRFELTRCGHTLRIRTGAVTMRSYALDTGRIVFVDRRQTLLTKLLTISSVFIQCTGYGKAKNEQSILLPATSNREIAGTMKMLLPELTPVRRSVRPGISGLLRFVWLPAALAVAPPVLTHFLTSPLPEWRQLIHFLAVMAELPAIWWLLISIAAFAATGLGLEGDTLTLRYTSGLRFHTVTLRMCDAVQIDVRRSIFQRFGDSCDIAVYAAGETRTRHILPQLPMDKALALLGLAAFTEEAFPGNPAVCRHEKNTFEK